MQTVLIMFLICYFKSRLSITRFALPGKRKDRFQRLCTATFICDYFKSRLSITLLALPGKRENGLAIISEVACL